MMNKYIRMTLLIMALSTTACTSMNSKFECQMKPGSGICASLSEVNQMIDRGQIRANTEKSALLANKAVSVQTPAIGYTPFEPKPLRTAETVTRVWIAPFEDKQGYYHLASEILLTTPGQWVGKLPNAKRA